MIKPLELLTRKELANLMRVSTDVLRVNETRWGLRACRVSLTRKTVLYRGPEAIQILRALRLM